MKGHDVLKTMSPAILSGLAALPASVRADPTFTVTARKEAVARQLGKTVHQVGDTLVLDTPDVAGPVRQDGVSGYLNLRTAYGTGRDDVSLDAHGRSAGITPLGRFGPTSNVNLTWKHAFGKTPGLTVDANDAVDGSLRTYRTVTRTLRQTGFDHFIVRRIYVGFVKKIG